MPELLEFALNAAVAPAVVLTSQADDEGDERLPQARPTDSFGHVGPLPGNQTTMPPHQCVRGHERGDRVERAAPEALGLRRQSTALIVGQPESPATLLLFEDPVLLDQVGDKIQLMPIHPAGNRQQEQLERERCGRHSAIVGALKSHVGGRLRIDPFFVQDGLGLSAKNRKAVVEGVDKRHDRRLGRPGFRSETEPVVSVWRGAPAM